MQITLYIVFMTLVTLYVLISLIRAIRRRGFFSLVVLIWFLVLVALGISVIGVYTIIQGVTMPT
ncbi:hypothetical protein [Pediococcus damnosus]|uniref:hypothetical protein n=1 Tax=Pediococcus damnosus TaxID=51663 RepID=UPI00061FE2A2|nr:hypothetical protein [Pediococcus damnosus]KJU74883.1 hypothetical protein AH70_04090 [Pediococcus damnosus LMG 28219]PIO81217.1 hypothetical protein BSQ38_05925 [Pediococcus damnosus]PIO85241.1 hypothetical protein BSQ37_04545 [Pediococcus damnosus]PJE49261.1 hypothetical protein BSQ36_04620 [Pediococcus damnosus]GEA92203.1 hypothetical protein PDA01_00960 [Pediococcus damnosus]